MSQTVNVRNEKIRQWNRFLRYITQRNSAQKNNFTGCSHYQTSMLQRILVQNVYVTTYIGTKRLCYKVYCYKTSMLQDLPSCGAERIYG